jgi:branched-chain amino acid transport system permease protein
MQFFTQQLANGIMLGSIYVLITLGLVIILSMMDIVNFAHGQLAIVGAYCILFLQNALKLSFLPGLVVAALMVAVIGFVIEKGVVRPTRVKKLPLLTAGIATIGLAMILEETIGIIYGRSPQAVSAPFGTNPIALGYVQMSLMRLLIPPLMAVVVAALLFFLYRVKLGRGLRAVAQDADAASLQGINVDAAMSIGFVISCCLASLAGTFLAQMMSVTPYMGTTFSLKGFSIIVVGGMTSLLGAIAASFILGIGESLVGAYAGGGYQEMFFFAAMVIILLIRPSGLMGRGVR